MQALGVSDLIIPAITQASWAGISVLCHGQPQLHAAYGLHPIYLAEHTDVHLKQLARFFHEHHEQIVAVGDRTSITHRIVGGDRVVEHVLRPGVPVGRLGGIHLLAPHLRS